jgi:hypothetical protein
MHQKRIFELPSDVKNGIRVPKEKRIPQYSVGPFLGVNDTARNAPAWRLSGMERLCGFSFHTASGALVERKPAPHYRF